MFYNVFYLNFIKKIYHNFIRKNVFFVITLIYYQIINY